MSHDRNVTQAIILTCSNIFMRLDPEKMGIKIRVTINYAVLVESMKLVSDVITKENLYRMRYLSKSTVLRNKTVV